MKDSVELIISMQDISTRTMKLFLDYKQTNLWKGLWIHMVVSEWLKILWKLMIWKWIQLSKKNSMNTEKHTTKEHLTLTQKKWELSDQLVCWQDFLMLMEEEELSAITEELLCMVSIIWKRWELETRKIWRAMLLKKSFVDVKNFLNKSELSTK